MKISYPALILTLALVSSSAAGLELTPMGVVAPARSVNTSLEDPTTAVALPVENVPVPVASTEEPTLIVSEIIPTGPTIQNQDNQRSTVSALPLESAPISAPTQAPAARLDHSRLTGGNSITNITAPTLHPSPSSPVASVAAVDLTAVPGEAPAIAPPIEPEQVWVVPDHGTLRQLIESWGQRAGWRVVWDTDLDYPMEASFEVPGDFLTAADTVFAAYANAKEKFAPMAHPNNVLFVRQMGIAR